MLFLPKCPARAHTCRSTASRSLTCPSINSLRRPFACVYFTPCFPTEQYTAGGAFQISLSLSLTHTRLLCNAIWTPTHTTLSLSLAQLTRCVETLQVVTYCLDAHRPHTYMLSLRLGCILFFPWLFSLPHLCINPC
ncbi:unnamed protein product [Ectocarpus sp. 4 AP-2014]